MAISVEGGFQLLTESMDTAIPAKIRTPIANTEHVPVLLSLLLPELSKKNENFIEAWNRVLWQHAMVIRVETNEKKSVHKALWVFHLRFLAFFTLFAEIAGMAAFSKI